MKGIFCKAHNKNSFIKIVKTEVRISVLETNIIISRMIQLDFIILILKEKDREVLFRRF